MRDETQRGQVATASRVLGASGVGDLIWGHASVRDQEGRGAWLKHAGWGLEEIVPERVHLVGWDGTAITDEAHRHSEWPIHTQVYRARPDVGAVVHVHSRHALALASTSHPLLPVSHEANLFADHGVPRFERTADLIVSEYIGDSLATTLGASRAVLIPNHGVVCVGADVPEAVMTAVLLERACEQQILTISAAAGSRFIWSEAEESAAKGTRIYTPAAIADAYAYLVRRLELSEAGTS